MNQPTRDEFDQIVNRVTRIEQRTEEIKAVRVEVASEDVVNRLKILEEGQEELKEDTAVLKIQMQGARADILQVRESQADLRDTLKEHGQRLESIEQKQDAHSELLGQLINIGEEMKTSQAEHTKRFDRIETTMATKDDINKLEGIMMQILKRLPKAEGQ
jgi:chromosome segregation ATPase